MLWYLSFYPIFIAASRHKISPVFSIWAGLGCNHCFAFPRHPFNATFFHPSFLCFHLFIASPSKPTIRARRADTIGKFRSLDRLFLVLFTVKVYLAEDPDRPLYFLSLIHGNNVRFQTDPRYHDGDDEYLGSSDWGGYNHNTIGGGKCAIVVVSSP